MTTKAITDAAERVVSMLDGIDNTDTWGGLRCDEVDTLAELAVVVGRADVAANILVWHSYADTTADDDRHAEIGDAAREQDGAGIEWTERTAHRLAVAYAAELA